MATATPSPIPTPTLDPHALLQRYVTALTADINALPQDVKAPCAQGVDACGRALDAAEALAQKGVADLQALPAEPASAMQAVEDIRSGLRFTLGLGANVRSGQNSPADDAATYDNIHHQLESDLALLTQVS